MPEALEFLKPGTSKSNIDGIDNLTLFKTCFEDKFSTAPVTETRGVDNLDTGSSLTAEIYIPVSENSIALLAIFILDVNKVFFPLNWLIFNILK